jgi:hypothetical protein
MSVALSPLHNPFGGLWFPHFSPPLDNILLIIPLPDIAIKDMGKKSPLMIAIIKVFLL